MSHKLTLLSYFKVCKQRKWSNLELRVESHPILHWFSLTSGVDWSKKFATTLSTNHMQNSNHSRRFRQFACFYVDFSLVPRDILWFSIYTTLFLYRRDFPPVADGHFHKFVGSFGLLNKPMNGLPRKLCVITISTNYLLWEKHLNVIFCHVGQYLFRKKNIEFILTFLY